VFKAYDYSNHAVKLIQVKFGSTIFVVLSLTGLQSNPLYTLPPCGSINASVWDVTSINGLPADMPPGSVDIVVLVFVLSALHPDEWGKAINNIHTVRDEIVVARWVGDLRMFTIL
jgi:tRNAThr (cytosine32-N3)-methyltransferase